MAIYGSAEGTTLGNLSWNEMVVYIFMVYVTTSIVSISISDWIGDDVVDGIVAMNLIKPIDYRMSLIFRALGNSIHRFISPAVFVWIGLELVKVFYFNMEVTPLSRILAYIVSCIMSFMIFLLLSNIWRLTRHKCLRAIISMPTLLSLWAAMARSLWQPPEWPTSGYRY